MNIAKMLLVNKYIRKVELEGNKLGPNTARALGEVLNYNKTLLFLDLENNSLTQEGDDPSGMNAFLNALKTNTTLRSLNVANNALKDAPQSPIGNAFVECLASNTTLIQCDFGQNDFNVETTRKL